MTAWPWQRWIMRGLRRRWRAVFAPEPPVRSDGLVIQLRTLTACRARGERWSYAEWLHQAQLRGAQNQARDAAWRAGEPFDG
jgi:hypothetical protein